MGDGMKAAAIVVLVVAVALIITFYPKGGISERPNKFSSFQQLQDFVKTNMQAGYSGGFYSQKLMAVSSPAAKAAETAGAATDYSSTNIQVEGVDEADIVKNDGRYIYNVSGGRVFITDAYPADGMKVLGEVKINGDPQEIFVSGDRLVVFGQENKYYPAAASYYKTCTGSDRCILSSSYLDSSFIRIYDIADRSNPVLKRNLTMEGHYYDSRMIGDYVYAIVNQPVFRGEDIVLPVVNSGAKEVTVPATDIYYFGMPDYSYTYTTIVSVNVRSDAQEPESEVFLKGSTQDLYVSQENIFITNTKQMSWSEQQDIVVERAILPSLPLDIAAKINMLMDSNLTQYEKNNKMGGILQNYAKSLGSAKRTALMEKMEQKMLEVMKELAKEMEKTVIHRISISSGNIEYRASGTVPGIVLNQFSMDEYNGYLRIATTTGEVSRMGKSTSANHIYILDSTLSITGKLEDLAPGEKIYSVRFLGNRAYMVTFKKIDPLFVIDLSNPNNPAVLGKLKIPGYSDYLHPYDESHIIGIGKETVEGNEEGTFAWYQGVKIALFDVSDVSDPKEEAKFIIGDRGTDSYALNDHKAFLFSKDRNLLVIPILLAEIDRSRYGGEVPANAYGEYKFKGAYVLSISTEGGINLKGRVTHALADEKQNMQSYWYTPYSIKRSLYMGNTLYTVSESKIKASNLDTMEEVKEVGLSPERGMPVDILLE